MCLFQLHNCAFDKAGFIPFRTSYIEAETPINGFALIKKLIRKKTVTCPAVRANVCLSVCVCVFVYFSELTCCFPSFVQSVMPAVPSSSEVCD